MPLIRTSASHSTGSRTIPPQQHSLNAIPQPDTNGTASGKKTPRRVQWAHGTSQPPSGTRSAPPHISKHHISEETEYDGSEDDENIVVQVQPDGLTLPVSSQSLLARRVSGSHGAGENGSDGARSVLSLDEEGLDVRLASRSPFALFLGEH